MVLSMTGYGRAEEVRNGRDIAVELRSVNSRYFEYSCRVPRTCAFLEDPLKRLVAEQVHRGKVELSLSIQNVSAADAVVQINWGLAESYCRALSSLAERLDITPQYVSDIEQGKKCMSMSIFVEMSQVLEVGMEFLAYGALPAEPEVDRLCRHLRQTTPLDRELAARMLRLALEAAEAMGPER